MASKGFHVTAFLDRNPAFSGVSFMGAPVITPDELTDLDTPVVVAVETPLWSIIKKLREKGFRNIVPYVFIIFDQEVDEVDSANHYLIQSFYYEVFRSKKNNNSLLSIDIPVTMRCSLRCRDCSNLMQYFKKPRHADFEQMKRAVKKLFDLIDFTFDVRILGGEPFMNPDLYKFIDLFHAYSSKFAYMWVITNGTIIPDERNLEALKNRKIFVRISDYQNPRQQIEKLVSVLVKNGIFHEIVPIQAWQDCSRIQNYHRTQEENEAVLRNCGVRDTPTIIDGKIFRCPLSGSAWLLSILPPELYEYVELLNSNDSNDSLRRQIQGLMRQKYLKACNFCGNRSINTNRIPPAIQTGEPLEYDIYARI
ncbi:MAG: radical SAM protein [Spirochaetaceae bacterium]|nr:radical SAM protein [Spirochaetaceae bacterium]